MRAWVTELWHCGQGWAGGQGARASHPQQAQWDGKAQAFWEMLCPISPSLGTHKELEQEDHTLHRSRPSGPLAPACPQVSYRPENVHFLVRSPQQPAHILELGGCTHLLGASQVALVVKNPPTNAEDIRDMGLIPGLGRSLGGENGNPLQYSFLENPHGQRSLADYSPWGHTESDLTEVT